MGELVLESVRPGNVSVSQEEWLSVNMKLRAAEEREDLFGALLSRELEGEYHVLFLHKKEVQEICDIFDFDIDCIWPDRKKKEEE